MAKRTMRSFKISEISAVDRPAQAHAKKTLMKRADDDKESEDMTSIASFQTLDEAVAAIAKAERLPRSRAMSQAAQRFPGLLQKYQDEGDEFAKAAAEASRPRAPQASQNWDNVVTAVMQRDGVPRSVAMRRARTENPTAFEALQRG